ncbi:hypothetical protein BGZ99_002349, partial [Dissophora globulifera]
SIIDPCFQNIYLLTFPAAFALVLFVFRLYWLSRHGKPHNFGRTAWIYWPSQALMASSCAILLTELVAPDAHLDLPAKLATIFMLLAWALAMMLNRLESKYSIRASDVILSYYIAALL